MKIVVEEPGRVAERPGPAEGWPGAQQGRSQVLPSGPPRRGQERLVRVERGLLARLEDAAVGGRLADQVRPLLQVGMEEDRPAVELERLAPGINELGKAVAVGVADLAVGEVVAVEGAAERPLAFDEQGVKRLGPGRLGLVGLGETGPVGGGEPGLRCFVDQAVAVVIDPVIAGRGHLGHAADGQVLVECRPRRPGRAVDPGDRRVVPVDQRRRITVDRSVTGAEVAAAVPGRRHEVDRVVGTPVGVSLQGEVKGVGKLRLHHVVRRQHLRPLIAEHDRRDPRIDVKDGGQDRVLAGRVGPALDQRLDPVGQGGFQLRDERLRGDFLGAAGAVEPGRQDDPEEDADDDHHDQELDQREAEPARRSPVRSPPVLSHGVGPLAAQSSRPFRKLVRLSFSEFRTPVSVELVLAESTTRGMVAEGL